MPTGLKKLDQLTQENAANPKLVNKNIIDLVYNMDILIAAYGKIKSRPGNMTPGADRGKETLDGISMEWLNATAETIRTGEFKFNPSRRIEITKPQGGKRPLSISSPRDKVVQQAILMVLQAIFEGNFLDSSHGFRPNRSCHTALQSLHETFSGVQWFIEGDITKCFDSFDHKIIIDTLSERIQDQAFTDLIRKALTAGYIDLEGHRNYERGSPQGYIISPIICNILMHKFDL